ncbi:MAG: threonine--tRNA ligase [Promethearchaeota archaeon]
MNIKQNYSSIENEFLIFQPDGRLTPPDEFLKNNKLQEEVKPLVTRIKDPWFAHDFGVLVRKEALGQITSLGNEQHKAANVKLISQLHLAEADPFSDAGHLRFLPKGALIYDLITDYAYRLALEEGASPVHSSILYDESFPGIAEHLKLFGEQAYHVKPENRQFVFRYAACFGQFSMLHNKVFSYQHLPFQLFELADSYRYERKSQVSGMYRQRRFLMPDMHIFCERDSNLDKAKAEFKRIYMKIMELGYSSNWRYVVLVNLRTDFYESHRGFIQQLAQLIEAPVLLRFISPAKGYYWMINIEFCIIDSLDRPVEIATVQMDVGNAERFNIRYVDAEGQENYPIILHTALIGSIERYFNAILENASLQAKRSKTKISLPFWLCPVQIRLIPIQKTHEAYCYKLLKRLQQHNLRVDVDNRLKSLNQRIRDAERELIPWILVIGEKELKNSIFQLRSRVKDENKVASEDELLKLAKVKQGAYPFRPLPLPKDLRSRPAFF